MTELLLALALATVALSALASTLLFSYRQLAFLEHHNAAISFLYNLSEHLRANPAGDYRWHGASGTFPVNCRTQRCAADHLARFDLHRAHDYLADTVPAARFEIERAGNWYHIALYTDDKTDPVRLTVWAR